MRERAAGLSSCIDRRTQRISEGFDGSSWNTTFAVISVCAIVLNAFFMLCVTSLNDRDSKTESACLLAGVVSLDLLFPLRDFHERIDCKVFDRCESKVVRVSVSGRESRR